MKCGFLNEKKCGKLFPIKRYSGKPDLYYESNSFEMLIAGILKEQQIN